VKELNLATVFVNEQTVYKVLNSARGSCLARGQYYVHYLWGEFIRAPEGTKFFVFESLVNAEDFRQRDADFRIWRATARGLYSPAGRIGDPKYSSEIEDFWRNNKSGRSYSALVGRRTPPGTLWADEIRLDEYIVREQPDTDGVCPPPTRPVPQARLHT
jgi:hypothetical protein